jgi:hypothetical protein
MDTFQQNISQTIHGLESTRNEKMHHLAMGCEMLNGQDVNGPSHRPTKRRLSSLNLTEASVGYKVTTKNRDPHKK